VLCGSQVSRVKERKIAKRTNSEKMALRARKHTSGWFAPPTLNNTPLDPHRADLENDDKISEIEHVLTELCIGS
jgi:hypothetical protein